MNEAAPLDDNELVVAALSLFANQERGAKPDWQEIEAWQQKTLDDQRAEEVLSHIANDSSCFQQWLDICEATEWLAQEPSVQNTRAPSSSTSSIAQSVKAWIASLFGQPLPVYAAGFAALFLAVLVVPLLRDGDSLQQRLDNSYELYMAAPPGSEIGAPVPRKTRTLGNLFENPTPASIEQYYFGQGLRQGVDRLQASPETGWAEWLNSLPEDELDCTKAADSGKCTGVADDFRAVGQWAVMVYSACQGVVGADNREFWQQQYTLHADLQQLPAMQDSVLLQPAIAGHSGKDKDSVCASVGQLLNTLQ